MDISYLDFDNRTSTQHGTPTITHVLSLSLSLSLSL